MPVPGFNIQHGANKIDTIDSCDSYTYVYKNAANTLLPAGSTINFPFFMNFDQSKETPKITYIKFGSSQCGAIPTCPATTAPTSSTENPTTVTENPTTVTENPTTVTEEPTENPTTENPGGLSQSCDSFIRTKHSWDSGFDGEFIFPLQSTITAWQLTVRLIA